MLHYSGIIQLGAVVKEDVTEKGNKKVFFTAYTKRSNKESDKLFFVIYGSNADFFIRNLIKKEDGGYHSRKMYIVGHLETYISKKKVTMEKVKITPDMLPKELGTLKESIDISVTKNNHEELQYMFVVTHLTFEDKKDNSETVEIIKSNSYNPDADITVNDECDEDISSRYSSLESVLNSATKGLNSPDILKTLV